MAVAPETAHIGEPGEVACLLTGTMMAPVVDDQCPFEAHFAIEGKALAAARGPYLEIGLEGSSLPQGYAQRGKLVRMLLERQAAFVRIAVAEVREIIGPHPTYGLADPEELLAPPVPHGDRRIQTLESPPAPHRCQPRSRPLDCPPRAHAP
jgi:hypothetical protein